MAEHKKLSVIVSLYNEEEALLKFYETTGAVLASLQCDHELIFVNDGSSDKSRALLYQIAANDPKVRVIHFSRNFGHEAAMIAGIDHAHGDMLICLDADLQHPPQCIPDMVKAFEDGYDIVEMVRTSNKSAGAVKNVTSAGFYAVINSLSDTKFAKNASDFFGISARAAVYLRERYRDKTRYLRGYVQSLGFNKTSLEYAAADRVAGSSKYSIKKLFRFSVNTIVNFSDVPLRFGFYAGIMSMILSFVLFVWGIVSWIGNGHMNITILLFFTICVFFTITFFLLGFIGEYIGVIFSDIKDRPLYIVDEKLNFDKEDY